jgi:hypothetical protein
MSWDQSYSVPSFQELLEKLAGVSGTQLLIDHLEAKGLRIVDLEDITLDDGYFQEVKGSKVRLSDGRVFVPKLVERYTENGNYGLDTYAWFLIGETPEVQHVDGDRSDPQIEPGLDIPQECLLEDEEINHTWEG